MITWNLGRRLYLYSCAASKNEVVLRSRRSHTTSTGSGKSPVLTGHVPEAFPSNIANTDHDLSAGAYRVTLGFLFLPTRLSLVTATLGVQATRERVVLASRAPRLTSKPAHAGLVVSQTSRLLSELPCEGTCHTCTTHIWLQPRSTGSLGSVGHFRWALHQGKTCGVISHNYGG